MVSHLSSSVTYMQKKDKKGHYGTHFMVTGFNAPKMTDKLQYREGCYVLIVRLDHEKLFC